MTAAIMAPAEPLTRRPAWKALEQHYQKMRHLHLRQLQHLQLLRLKIRQLLQQQKTKK